MIINILMRNRYFRISCALRPCKILFIVLSRKLKFKFFQKSLEIITSTTDS